MGIFNKKADYFIHWPFDVVIRCNMAGNHIESIDGYYGPYLKSLKGPFIYSAEELERIIEAIEDIERCVRPEWSEFKRFACLHSRVISTITYDKTWKDLLNIAVPPYGCNKFRYEDNSLRGLASGITVCLGYSVILGELLWRQGIENHIAMTGDHAYSVVKLDGNYCVTDLVQDRAMLEIEGDFGALFWKGRGLGDFMAAENHRAVVPLIPDRDDPELCMVDEARYRSAVSSLLTRCFDMVCNRLVCPSKEVHIAQIGSVEVNGKEYFQYLCQTSADCKDAPALVHSKNNLCSIMSSKRVGNLDPSLEETIKSMFDPSNIADSVAIHRSDLGTVHRSSKTNEFPYYRVWKDTSLIDGRSRSFRRRDGTVLTAVPTADRTVKIGRKNIVLHRYRIFIGMSKGDSITYRGYSVSSETDLFSVYGVRESGFVADKLLGEEPLLSAARDRCGYVGSMALEDGIPVLAMNSDVCRLLSAPDAPETWKFTWRGDPGIAS